MTESVGSRTMQGVNAARRIDALGSLLVYCHHALIVTVGVFGLVEEPSPSVQAVLGPAGSSLVTGMWSVMFVLFGGAALVCRWFNRRGLLDTTRTECFCIILIGLALGLFSAFIIYTTVIAPVGVAATVPPRTPGSIQTALTLLSSSVFLPGVAAISLAQTRRERLRGGAARQTVMEDVRAAVRRSVSGD